MSSVDSEIPQWKKDLIARLRNQNRQRIASAALVERQQQLCTGPPQSCSVSVAVGCASASAVQQPNPPPGESVVTGAGSSVAVVSREPRGSAGAGAFFRSCISYQEPLNDPKKKMVQERTWSWEPLETVGDPYKNGDCSKLSDSDSSEDLHYGPGIVNRLKNKYLSLALRESNSRTRASILPMRKAASLENILDDDNIPGNGTDDCTGNRLFQSRLNNGSNEIKNVVPNRYRNTTRGSEMKRARSVEAISRTITEQGAIQADDVKPKRESLHEEMLIKADNKGSGKPSNKPSNDNNIYDNTKSPPIYPVRLNRPKRITPVMNEKEKPPVDFVKHTKLIFERRPELRTKSPHQTGEVAAKVATYKNIIVQAKVTKKPPVKTKPTTLTDSKPKTNGIRTRTKVTEKFEKNEPPKTLQSPIPDISRIELDKERGSKNSSLSETPDLIMTSSPITPTSPTKITENFLKEEIRHHSLINKTPTESPQVLSPVKTNDEQEDCFKFITPQAMTNIDKASSTVIYNFIKTKMSPNHLPPVVINKNVSDVKIPPSQPLKLEINGTHHNNVIVETKKSPPSPKPRSKILSPPLISPKNHTANTKPSLTILEIEKNKINTAKTLEQPKNSVILKTSPTTTNTSTTTSITNTEEVNKNQVPKTRKSSREPEPTTIVFKFTNRKDVPDYVHDDGQIRVAKRERPKSEKFAPSSMYTKISMLKSCLIAKENIDINQYSKINAYLRRNSVGYSPKKSKALNRQQIFKFLKEAPDYDWWLEKVGEGGIILLPGASLDESFTDEDDEILRSLEAPPSPCDVAFINDNILIDGKSSLSQKTKRAKLKISFMEAGPEIYEYPSESSLLIEETPTSPTNAQMVHTVPSITGSSSLANYTPKSTEDFQPGVTRTIPTNIPKVENTENSQSEDSVIKEAETPIQFSAGTNSDILF